MITFVSTDQELLDRKWISRVMRGEGWNFKISDEQYDVAIQNSICFGIYEREEEDQIAIRQVGFARVVTDSTNFSWICDVIIDPGDRRKGLGKQLLQAVVGHHIVKRTACALSTRDAATFYYKFGFEMPGEIMMVKRPINVDPLNPHKVGALFFGEPPRK